MVMTITALSLASCKYKDLEDGGEYVCDMKTVTLDFAWEKVDSSAVPGAMRVAFYPADKLTRATLTKGYAFFDLPKTIWPASIQLPAGTYHVTGWNNDVENIITDNYGSRETLFATTPAYQTKDNVDVFAVLDSIYQGQAVLDHPDYMVHGNEMDVQVLADESEQTVTLHPDSMVVTMEYYVRGIGGLERVRQVRGAINNVAGKRFMAYPNLAEDSVAVMFDCNYNAADSLVYGQLNVFGIEPTDLRDRLQHKLVLFFWMDNGRVYIPIDITKLYATFRKDQSRVVIDIPSLGIDLRNKMESNGFDVGLDEWDDVNIDVAF